MKPVSPEEKPQTGWHRLKDAGEKKEAARRRTKRDRDRTRRDRKWETSEEIQAATARVEENGGTGEKLPERGPLADRLAEKEE